MTDAQMLWFDFGGDIGIGSDMDLLMDDGLYTAVMISLFTDARAPLDVDLPDGETDRRGWWHNSIAGENIGSLLWLLRREKVLPETAARAQEYSKASLQWMLDNEIASAVNVTANLIRPVGMELLIDIRRGNSKEYAYLWDGVAESRAVKIGNTSIKLQFS